MNAVRDIKSFWQGGLWYGAKTSMQK